MIFACKCLNFIANSADFKYASASGDNSSEHLTSLLINSFLQKYPRNFQFYSTCMEFFKQTIGPIHDFTITTINQNDLIYELSLNTINDTAPSGKKYIWQISICINCNTTLCAKRLTLSDNNSPMPSESIGGDYFINSILLTNNDELIQRKSEKSFSDTFGILIIDHPINYNNQHDDDHSTAAAASGTAVATTTVMDDNAIDNNRQLFGLSFNADKQNRIKHLTQNMQKRLQKEIADTDERIQRYSEQQFALLKSFREKSEQEYQILLKLINQVPEPLHEITNTTTSNNDFIMMGGGRRRSTLTSTSGDSGNNRRSTTTTTLDLSTPTTPTTTNATLSLPSNSSISAIDNAQNPDQQQQQQIFAFNNRKTANFDTPPATPENIPMSVGNSPISFQQQQQQQQQQMSMLSSSSFYQQQQQQQQLPTNIDTVDDCFFELEGVENYHQSTECEMNKSLEENHNNISDFGVDSDDAAEEAEDALSLDTSISIPFAQKDNRYQQRAPKFGKSLPITIENPSMAQRTDITNSNDDLIDDNVDIAASIKALAKSVHGEAVFGDLPRPRLRSQE